jgi:DNA topoisomerase-1
LSEGRSVLPALRRTLARAPRLGAPARQTAGLGRGGSAPTASPEVLPRLPHVGTAVTLRPNRPGGARIGALGIHLAVPIRVAASTPLRYARDNGPGLSRRRSGRGFTYRRPGGSIVADPRTLNRIKRLAIPPAWADVWIAPDPRGHIQATGRDARGRKQYRYHSSWVAARDAAKYEHLLSFARVLPAIRRGVRRDLKEPPLSRQRVLATVVALLERTRIRVGNDEYARANGSYGLTTLLNRHVRIRGRHVEFRFRGKSGVHHVVGFEDATLAQEVRRCQELPGQTLFEYRNDGGRVRRVGSQDVNRYLVGLAGSQVTAKDFRTWWGTVSAFVLLRKAGRGRSRHANQKTVLSVLDAVARQLGNTRAVSKKCYVHPSVIEAFEQGVALPASRKGGHGLNAEEAAAVALIRKMRTGPSKRPDSRPMRRKASPLEVAA